MVFRGRPGLLRRHWRAHAHFRRQRQWFAVAQNVDIDLLAWAGAGNLVHRAASVGRLYAVDAQDQVARLNDWRQARDSAAVEAALDPAETDAYYWVTTDIGTGHTEFSRTYEEHQQHVRTLQRYCASNPGVC